MDGHLALGVASHLATALPRLSLSAARSYCSQATFQADWQCRARRRVPSDSTPLIKILLSHPRACAPSGEASADVKRKKPKRSFPVSYPQAADGAGERGRGCGSSDQCCPFRCSHLGELVPCDGTSSTSAAFSYGMLTRNSLDRRSAFLRSDPASQGCFHSLARAEYDDTVSTPAASGRSCPILQSELPAGRPG